MAPAGAARSVLITGAAGNLGGMLARHLAPSGLDLRLMYHRRPLARELLGCPRVTPVRADLRQPRTLTAAVAGVDTVVHFAGVLFAPRPERFLPETNTVWFDNLVIAALEARVRRLILISFPHVEGPTSPDRPATGRLDRQPISVHARTRLDEEKLLFERTGTRTTPVVLRLGMVYGRGVLMIEAARWLAERRLLAVWREPTGIQLLSVPDCMLAIEAAVARPDAHGIYHVGDEQPVTLQHFLDAACRRWGRPPARRLPLWTLQTAAALCEAWALVARTRSPLTRDFIRMGRVPYWGDTRRFRQELLAELRHPTLESGLTTL
ncbi:MAG TPA: NAD-dependent epimerase/dehydratase family protein [Vicinamibacteria bacterium]|nr:NAD-dependent epimerase/dehydratase family protein [Vicinamibacteria bacterium]